MGVRISLRVFRLNSLDLEINDWVKSPLTLRTLRTCDHSETNVGPKYGYV